MLKTFFNLEDTSNESPIIVESNSVPAQTIVISSEFNLIDPVANTIFNFF